jgi:phage terminase small subunit
MRDKLTERQQRFLDVLFDEAKGNFLEAKRLAGYSENVATSVVVNALEEEIAEQVKKYLATSGVKAAYTMVHAMSNPTELGLKEKMSAAKDILDRGGFKASEKVEVKTETPLFILPAKKDGD